MCENFYLEAWDREAEYLIIDDIDFERFGSYGRKSLWGAQREVVLTDKYMRKMKVLWGKPMIYLCNADQVYNRVVDKRGNNVLSFDQTEWYDANTCLVSVSTPMWLPLPGEAL